MSIIFIVINKQVAGIAIKLKKEHEMKTVQYYPALAVEKSYENVDAPIENHETHFSIVVGELKEKLGKNGDIPRDKFENYTVRKK